MRKLLSILLVVLMLTSLVACGGGDEPASSTPVSSESSTPESGAPETSEPETSKPETSEPDVSEPETSDTTKADQTTTTKKDDGKTTTTKKDDGKTTTTTKKPTDNDKTTTTTTKETTTTTKRTTTSRKTTTSKKTTASKPTTQYQTPNTEKPITADTADYYNPKSSTYDAQAETLRKSILNSKDSGLKPTGFGETYYISPNGNDSADGLSKASAWQTVKNLENGANTALNSVILFERGGVYRNVRLELLSGVSIGAYGSGPKPQLLASDKDYADEKLWKSAGTHLWKVDVSSAVAKCPNTDIMPTDIGNIVFDHGKTVAGEFKQRALKNVDSDYDFYFDKATNLLYMYLSKGNPGKVHANAEMVPNWQMISMKNSNHVIENICIKYGGDGIGTAGANNVTVRNCEIGWIGGVFLSNCRFGNGITFYNKADNCVAENNWIYQCFDAGYSHQSSNGAQTNIDVKGNLIEYCLYNIEIWTPANKEDQPMKDCTIEDNILRFAGFGWGTRGRKQYGTSSVWASHISMNSNKSVCDNVLIKNNIFDTSYRYLVCITHPNDTATPKLGPTITGNTWVQQTFRVNGNPNGDPQGSTASVAPLATGGVLYCGDQATMEASVAKVDTAPVKVLLEK